ncbi:MAG: hypothetical protein ACK4GN_06675 [Runella sp.]
MNPVIKDFYNKIRSMEDSIQQEILINELKEYVSSLSTEEQELYRQNAIASIESKLEIMDKLVTAYEAMKNDYLQFAQ